jgi:predicted DCC family thiol-disulfide oxidoreductase YuxK
LLSLPDAPKIRSVPHDGPIVLFDGVCNVCNGAVNFVLDHETARALRFASFQSTAGRAVRAEHGLGSGDEADDPNSVVLLERGRVFERSTAVLRIASYLRWPYRALAAFVVVPRPLRDLVYRWFARHRYAWFGKADVCRVPTPELRARFLE